ncbi:MAG: hypothetical protein H0W72_13685 [Planctomycetes bacterium]|nr:hypothetical protein [Planctomycetota bacterium]
MVDPANAPDSAPADPLVLAMPRRELFAINGFTLQVGLSVLESLAEESWFALSSSLVGNLDAKEVRLGLVATREREVLIDGAGSLLHTTPILPEVGRLGAGIKAVRDLALIAGSQFLGVPRLRVELTGYCNDDSLPELRNLFLLVYRCRVPDGCPPPVGMSWVPIADLAKHPLDPASALVGGVLFPPVGVSS